MLQILPSFILKCSNELGIVKFDVWHQAFQGWKFGYRCLTALVKLLLRRGTSGQHQLSTRSAVIHRIKNQKTNNNRERGPLIENSCRCVLQMWRRVGLTSGRLGSAHLDTCALSQTHTSRHVFKISNGPTFKRLGQSAPSIKLSEARAIASNVFDSSCTEEAARISRSAFLFTVLAIDRRSEENVWRGKGRTVKETVKDGENFHNNTSTGGGWSETSGGRERTNCMQRLYR